MKTQIIELLRTEHINRTSATELSQSDKNQITRAFNRIVEKEGGMGMLFSRQNKITAVKDGSDSLRYVTPEEVGGYSRSSQLYSFYLNDMIYARRVTKSDVRKAMADVLPEWAIVDGNRSLALFVRGRKSSDQTRVTQIRQAALDSLGNITRVDYDTYSLPDALQLLTRAEAFKANSRAAFREAFRAVRPASDEKPVVKNRPKPMTSYLETLKSKQIPAKPEDLLALPLPGFLRTTRTWGIELEHVDMQGISKPSSDWQSKGDGSLRGAEGVNGDNCQACRPDRRQAVDNGEPIELIFNDNQRYPDGCTCADCIRQFVNSFSNLESVTEDEHGVWRMHKVSVPAEAAPVEEPQLPATWPCYCIGQVREFVSPVLETVNDENLKTLADQLVTRKTNSSAGVHVHVGARDLNLAAQAELIRNWGIIEGIIEPLYQRTERGYCKSHDVEHIEAAHKITSPRSTVKEGNHYNHFGSDRYRTVNLQALESHTTIEFRSMGPVYDYKYLIAWATFVRDMVNVAKAGTPAKIWHQAKSFKDVVKILETYGSEVGK